MPAELLQFLIKHWILSSTLLLVIILLLEEEFRNKAGGFRLSLSDATQLINKDRAILIDLRDSTAFENGHVVNALNFPQTEIMNKLDKLKKYQDKSLILIDDAGQQARAVGNILRKQGFKKVYSLAGGLKTWTQAGLPLTKTQLSTFDQSKQLRKQRRS